MTTGYMSAGMATYPSQQRYIPPSMAQSAYPGFAAVPQMGSQMYPALSPNQQQYSMGMSMQAQQPVSLSQIDQLYSAQSSSNNRYGQPQQQGYTVSMNMSMNFSVPSAGQINKPAVKPSSGDPFALL
jgi:hypothetical protein